VRVVIGVGAKRLFDGRKSDWREFWRLRYWDRAKDSNTPELFNENDCFCSLGLDPNVNEVASYVYNDISVSYTRDSYNIRLGINNAFDKQPPLLPQFTQFGNTGTNTVTEPVGISELSVS
jgi:outer membrane receptor protein involved in Fe transport